MSKKDEDKSNKNNRNHGFKIRYVVFVVLGVVLVSIIGAIVINELYKVGNGYYTEWEASDVLMFFAAILGAIGTVGLGGLTLWQNEKLREQNDRLADSNDEHQQKLEELTEQSNKLADNANLLIKKSNEQRVINKIIENEQRRINELSIAFVEFEKASDTIEIAKNFVGKSNVSFDAAFAQDKLYYSYMLVEQLLSEDTTFNYETSCLKIMIGATYEQGYGVLDELKKTGKLESTPREKVEKWQEATANFVGCRNKYLKECEKRINRLLLEDLSLDEVRLIYNYHQEAENGQDEDAE